MKSFRFITFILLLLPYLQFSQVLNEKNVLLVWGGYEPHKPELFSNIVEEWLLSQNANVDVYNDLSPYDSYDKLISYDLIIQSVTMEKISSKQANNLSKAVKNGVGIAGAHGGLTDSFRENTEFQYMIGGQFVAHPGGQVDYKVIFKKDELTEGLNNFQIKTEQYYMHVDPNIDVIAETKFDGKFNPWIDGVVMPVAWKKKHGIGKVFYFAIGHNPMEFKQHQDAWKLLTRGFNWASRK